MTDTDDGHRRVTLTRLSTGTYRATNPAGASLDLGDAEGLLSPVEVLLAAIGACSAIDVDVVTSRRTEPDAFEVTVSARKVRDEDAHLEDLRMHFRLAFPDGPDGDRAREVAPRAVRASHERNCTVSRTVERGTPVAVSVEAGDRPDDGEMRR